MDIVVTDLDGTLLDEKTYSYEDALPAIEILNTRSVPLVFCTSKTRSEVEYWRRRIRNNDPFIVENGAAVYIPQGRFEFPIPNSQPRGRYDVMQLGTPRTELVVSLRNASAQSACTVRGFHEMSTQEVSELCGLTPEIAELAKDREFDEPFVILEPEREAALLAAVDATGKHFTRGGRFCHIIGNNDKASVVKCLLDLYRRIDPGLRTIGLGDGPNDIPLLNSIDLPVLIRGPWLDRLTAGVPHGRPTRLPGPAGWNEAITAILGEPGTRNRYR